jgi:hypothetical protein
MMNYATGEAVKLGDKVGLGDDSDGVVVFVIDTREYSAAYLEAEWSYLKKGVMLSFPKYGLIHYEQTAEEPDLKLIARGATPIKTNI